MRTAVIINIFLLLFLSSCVKDKSIKRYYPGGITYIATPINNSDSVFYGKWYYKNGNLAQEGMVINDSIFEGLHKLYFEDGTLEWEGYIKNSVIQGEYKKDFTWVGVEKYLKYIEFEGHPKKRQIGDTLKFRVIMPEIHPQFYMVYDLDYNLLANYDSPYLFPWKYIPTKRGRMYFRIMFMDKNGAFIVGNPEFIVESGIEVE